MKDEKPSVNASRILWGQVILVSSIVLIAIWTATQWTAWRLGFQPGLGKPWFQLTQTLPVYFPFIFFWWWYAFDAYAPKIFLEGGAIAASGGFISIAVAISLSVLRGREENDANTHGSARWAQEKEIEKAGLLAPDGVILGKHEHHYLRHFGPEHVLCFAPTRSGKGVGLVVPSLLTWPGSAIVHDIKGENWTLTAGFRANYGRVLLFDPTNIASDAYNPLLEIRKGEWEVRDVQNVADVLVDPEGSLERRNHWEKTSHALLVGAILHVLYAEKDKTLAGVAAFLSDPARTIDRTLEIMMKTPHLGEGIPHPVVASAARELKNKSENERSGVLSTAMSFLGLYRDPVVAHATRQCDWRIQDLVSSCKPTTLYLVIPPSDINRTKPLIRLILNQIGRRLTEELQTKTKRQRILLMLDEFPALGRLDFFESALAFMAGYGMKAFLIAQSLNQIEKAYGPNNSILDNCHVRVSFATNDERTAKRVSDALGTATEMKAQQNYAGHRLSPWLGHLMVSRSEVARPLLTPGEIMQLPADEEIIMVAGAPPIRARKARYFDDPQLLTRILVEPKRSLAKDHQDLKNEWDNCFVPHPETEPVLQPIHGQESESSGIRHDKSARNHEKINPEQKTPTPQQELSFANARKSIASQITHPERLQQKSLLKTALPRSQQQPRDVTLQMRDRLNVYFPPAMLEQITDLAKRKRLSKSSIVSAAVASFFSPDSDDKREAAFVRRLDRLTRQVQRLERNVEISADTLALFIQFWLVLNPPLPSDRLKEAQIQSQLRYKGFIETLGRRLQGGHNFIQELSQDIEARKNYSEEES